jgi:hypothetical protein
MSARFIACPACARHVRAGDEVCPFCGAKAAIPEPRRWVRGRFTRAALHAAGAAGAVVALADCSSTGNTRTTAFYGASCTGDACVQQEDSGVADSSYMDTWGTGIFYGAACVDGSCNPPDTGSAIDAPTDSRSANPEAGEAGESDAGSDASADASGSD